MIKLKDAKKILVGNLKEVALFCIGEVSTRRLMKRGLIVGLNFNRQQGCFIDPSHCWLIEIGNNVTFSIRVVVLAHDASTKKILNFTKIGRVTIEDNVFIGANSLVLPNVNIGKNSIIGANSVVSKDIPPDVVAAGNPAKIIYSMDEYIKLHTRKMESQVAVFDSKYTMTMNVSEIRKKEMIVALKNNIGYIE
ncbi:MAG: acyltransferase [Polaromonas sp.]